MNSYIQPDWPLPSQIKAYSTTRLVGDSLPPFERFNLATHVADQAAIVEKNRSRLMKDLQLPSSPAWLQQEHRCEILALGEKLNEKRSNEKLTYTENNSMIPLLKCSVKWSAEPPTKSSLIRADASYTSQKRQVCVVMTADCLPILLASKTTPWVAAVHAGWRGLAAGIVEKSIAHYAAPSSDLIAWLGPAISQKHFEVGAEVKAAFCRTVSDYSSAFVVSGENKYYCDLYQIASQKLAQYGIECYGGDYCTFSDASLFYSYRREGVTGRMASLIWIEE